MLTEITDSSCLQFCLHDIVGKIVEPKIEHFYGQNSASMATVRPHSDQFAIQWNLLFFSLAFALTATSLHGFKFYWLSARWGNNTYLILMLTLNWAALS